MIKFCDNTLSEIMFIIKVMPTSFTQFRKYSDNINFV